MSDVRILKPHLTLLTNLLSYVPFNLIQVLVQSWLAKFMCAHIYFLPIVHIDSIALPTLQGTLLLVDVLVCHVYMCSYEFDYDDVIVKDKWTKQLLTHGNKHDDLYVLENPHLLAFYSTRLKSTSDEVW